MVYNNSDVNRFIGYKIEKTFRLFLYAHGKCILHKANSDEYERVYLLCCLINFVHRIFTDNFSHLFHFRIFMRTTWTCVHIIIPKYVQCNRMSRRFSSCKNLILLPTFLSRAHSISANQKMNRKSITRIYFGIMLTWHYGKWSSYQKFGIS